MPRTVLPLFIPVLLLILAAPAPSHADHDGRGVTLYADEGYRGQSETFYEDALNLKGTRIGNDRASSIRVARGCYAVLYRDREHYGDYIRVEGDLYALAGTEVGNDAVSSLEVHCRGRGSAERGVVLYQDVGYRGRSEVLEYDDADLRDNVIGNDRASSLYVSPDCDVTLFEDTDFRGRWLRVEGDIVDLGQTQLGNDRVSSIQVRCRGYGRPGAGRPGYSDGRPSGRPGSGDGYGTLRSGAQIFSQPGYRGTSEILTREDPRLADNRVGNNGVGSIRVASGCDAVLFEHEGYWGKAVVVSRDTADLSRLGLRGKVSSIVVRCWDRDRDRRRVERRY